MKTIGIKIGESNLSDIWSYAVVVDEITMTPVQNNTKSKLGPINFIAFLFEDFAASNPKRKQIATINKIEIKQIHFEFNGKNQGRTVLQKKLRFSNRVYEDAALCPTRVPERI